MGYCICTDYHARILEHLGYPEANLTFLQLMAQRLFGWSVSWLWQTRGGWWSSR